MLVEGGGGVRSEDKLISAEGVTESNNYGIENVRPRPRPHVHTHTSVLLALSPAYSGM